MEKVGDCLNMEDIFVELEGRVEKGPDFMLQLENNLENLVRENLKKWLEKTWKTLLDTTWKDDFVRENVTM